MVWAVGTERVKHRVGQGFFPLLTAGFVGCAMDGGVGGVCAYNDFKR
jgi:hypothetical protein